MNSWGGEPYNTARVRAVKAGIYELRFDYQNVAYFNSVPFFANPLFEQGNLESQHQFDISQRFARVEQRRARFRNCTVCHREIHGSNVDPAFFR